MTPQNDISDYGIDEDGPVLLHGLNEREVYVPETSTVISQQQLQDLVAQIDPMAYSDCHGADIYVSVREFLHNLT